MATGKSGYFDVSNGGFTLRINWSETYDITANTSVVSITSADLMSSSYSGYSYYPHHYIKVNGETVAEFNSTLGTHSYYISAKNTFYGIDAASGSPPPWTSSAIAHNDDGSKSITIEVYINLWRTSSGAGNGTNLSGTQTIALTTIPRKSTLSVSNGTLGSAQTLTVTRKSTSFTHTITAKCGSASTTVCTKSSSTSISFTPPIGWASQNTTGTIVPVVYTITTYSGSTSVGSNSYTVNCGLPASVKPSLSIAVSDAMGYASTYGGYIKGLSKFKIVLTPTTSYGSAISNYYVEANGSIYNSSTVTTNVVKNAGSNGIYASVTDKRGRSAAVSTTVTVLDYTAPVISLLKVNRCNSDGTANEQGSYIKITWSGTVTSLSSKNTARWILYYKKSTASSYSSVTLSTGTTFSFSNKTYVMAADTGSSYNIKMSVTDNFTTTSKETVASTAFTMMHFNADGNGMAIGKVSEVSGRFDVGMPSQFRNNMYFDNTIPIYMYKADGSTRNAMMMSSGNALLIGKGGRDNADVDTYIDGNNVTIRTNGSYVKTSHGLTAGTKISIWSDNEGGNLQLDSPNGIAWQMDAYNNNFRLYSNDGTVRQMFSFNYSSRHATYYGHIYLDNSVGQRGFLLQNSTTNKYTVGLYGNSSSSSSNISAIFYDNTNDRTVWNYDVVNNKFYINTANTTFAGHVYMGTGWIQWSGGCGITSAGSTLMYFNPGNESYRLIYGYFSSSSGWAFGPEGSGNISLGSSSHLWKQVYASSTTISTSDKNLKKNIKTLTDNHIKFFMLLQPVSFQFINGDSGRTHIGFISQDVEEAMAECGISDLDFAGFCRDQKTERVKKIREVEKTVDVKRINEETGEEYYDMDTVLEEVEYYEDVPIEGEYIYSLRYEEFIALNTHVIQHLYNENYKLKTEIAELKDEITKIKAAIGL